MKIILNEDVYNLGEEGDVREVANGYARNYLLPQGLAVVYNKQTQAVFKSRKAAIEKRKEEKRAAAQSLKQKLEGLSLTVKMPAGETGKLFGSVNNAVVAEALEKEGVEIERKKIDVPTTSIKNIGKYTVLIKLYSGEVAKIELLVASTDGKAEAALAKKLEAAKTKSEEKAVGAGEDAYADDEDGEEYIEVEEEVEAEEEAAEEETVVEEADAEDGDSEKE
ncbi:MAG: 50S ribosomal protein L9 [Spirochaetales bacterium]|uniref:Large ribosomal subunit protein bL9 n=1 Tax=Candidatus Thalassospirochaeta sargassi TaxID=3119039 RepID=A0AAJ1IAD8_9SPIO|nr:50S ribosomal protein L9 [Spirochaetales bacterium]